MKTGCKKVFKIVYFNYLSYTPKLFHVCQIFLSLLLLFFSLPNVLFSLGSHFIFLLLLSLEYSCFTLQSRVFIKVGFQKLLYNQPNSSRFSSTHDQYNLNGTNRNNTFEIWLYFLNLKFDFLFFLFSKDFKINPASMITQQMWH